MTRVRGPFEVSMASQPAEEGGGPVDRMVLEKTYAGPLEATAKGQMLAVRTDVPGSAGYVAMETVNGALEGRRGTFVLMHYGEMSGGNQTLSVTVIPDSGTGELTGLAGSLQIEIIDGQHFYVFDYALPAQ